MAARKLVAKQNIEERNFTVRMGTDEYVKLKLLTAHVQGKQEKLDDVTPAEIGYVVAQIAGWAPSEVLEYVEANFEAAHKAFLDESTPKTAATKRGRPPKNAQNTVGEDATPINHKKAIGA